jgi:hypothetical protein
MGLSIYIGKSHKEKETYLQIFFMERINISASTSP